jgi:LPXTG-motif cell wall-anchored protein
MKKNRVMCIVISVAFGLFSTLSSSIPVFAADATEEFKEMYSMSEINIQVAVPVEEVQLKLGVDGNTISDYEGNEAGFPVSGVADDMTIEYSIADESIAKIVYSDNTNVTVACLKEGTTVLTAKTSDGQLAEMEIVVRPVEKEAEPLEKAELKLGVDGNVISDYEGNEAGFPVSGVADDMTIEYSIADEGIAKIVYSDNTNVTVACLKEGATVLTAKTSDGQTAEMEIVVLPVEKEAVPVDGDLPQTGYSNIYRVIAGLAALMTVSGAALVVKTRKENE